MCKIINIKRHDAKTQFLENENSDLPFVSQKLTNDGCKRLKYIYMPVHKCYTHEEQTIVNLYKNNTQTFNVVFIKTDLNKKVIQNKHKYVWTRSVIIHLKFTVEAKTFFFTCF